MQIRTKLTLQFFMLVAILMLCCFLILYYISYTYRKNEFYKRLARKSETTAQLLLEVKEIDSTTLRVFDKNQKDLLFKENITVFNSSNRQLYTNNDTVNFNYDAKLLHQIKVNHAYRFTQGPYDILGMIYYSGNDYFYIISGAIDVDGKRRSAFQLQMLSTIYVVLLIVVLFMGWVFSRKALRPLQDVIHSVHKLSAKNLKERILIKNENDEIGALVQTFNMLLDRIEEALVTQRIFLSGASHEIKNPLTSVTSQLQVALLNNRSEAEYKKVIQSVLDDLSALNKTTHDLIDFAVLANQQESHWPKHPVRIDELIWECSDYFKRTMPEYKIKVDFMNLPSEEQRMLVLGIESQLRIALHNLIDNACKFSNQKSCSIQLHVLPQQVRIDISNEGDIIREEDRKLIFEPFYRSDQTSGKQGHGIGLALVKRIIELHHGSIEVFAENTGNRIALCLPVIF